MLDCYKRQYKEFDELRKRIIDRNEAVGYDITYHFWFLPPLISDNCGKLRISHIKEEDFQNSYRSNNKFIKALYKVDKKQRKFFDREMGHNMTFLVDHKRNRIKKILILIGILYGSYYYVDFTKIKSDILNIYNWSIGELNESNNEI